MGNPNPETAPEPRTPLFEATELAAGAIEIKGQIDVGPVILSEAVLAELDKGLPYEVAHSIAERIAEDVKAEAIIDLTAIFEARREKQAKPVKGPEATG